MSAVHVRREFLNFLPPLRSTLLRHRPPRSALAPLPLPLPLPLTLTLTLTLTPSPDPHQDIASLAWGLANAGLHEPRLLRLMARVASCRLGSLRPQDCAP